MACGFLHLPTALLLFAFATAAPLSQGVSTTAVPLRSSRTPPPPPVTSSTAVEYDHIVVIADLHGDLKQAMRALLNSRLITLQPDYYNVLEGQPTNFTSSPDTLKIKVNAHKALNRNYLNFNMMFNKRADIMLGSDPDMYHWNAGRTLAVCTGDAMNVGPDDLGIVRLIMRLSREASAAGGHFEFLLGNHEMQNLAGDFDGVHPWSFETSGGYDGRLHLLSMKSDIGAYLRRRKVMYLYNGWLFVHGGVLPATVEAIRLVVKPFNPSDFWIRCNEAVTAYLTRDKTGPSLSKETLAIASIFTNVNYTTNGEINPLLVRPEDSCDGVKAANRLLAGAVRAQIVGHQPHPLPDFVFCDGELFAIDFGNSQWKTGVGAPVATMLLAPPREASAIMKLAKSDDTRYYQNEQTLGDWIAALDIVTADKYPAEQDLEEAEFWYRLVIGVLLMVALILGIQLLRMARKYRRLEDDNDGTPEDGTEMRVASESTALAARGQKIVDAHRTKPPVSYGSMSPPKQTG